MYATEQELVDVFLGHMTENPWDIIYFGIEFNYMRGRADVIACSPTNELIAIEAKLSKWRVALHQAYRNRCFADKSYVLLPDNVAQIACGYGYEFEKRGVGICCIKDNRIRIIKEAVVDKPIQPWLKERAIQYVIGKG